MASFNEYSIGKFALCLNRNKELLTRLFQASEPVYFSQVIEDDAYKNCDINGLIDMHIVNILGKEMLSLTPEFHEMISKAFSLGYLVSDHDVMRYKEKLESDIEDCNASKDFRHDIYLRRVKSDIGEIIMVMSSSVDELNAAVEREFKYAEDNELKKEHLVRFLNTDKKLHDLIFHVSFHLALDDRIVMIFLCLFKNLLHIRSENIVQTLGATGVGCINLNNELLCQTGYCGGDTNAGGYPDLTVISYIKGFHYADVELAVESVTEFLCHVAQVNVVISDFTVVYCGTEILVGGVGSAVLECVLTCQDTIAGIAG